MPLKYSSLKAYHYTGSVNIFQSDEEDFDDEDSEQTTKRHRFDEVKYYLNRYEIFATKIAITLAIIKTNIK